MVPSVDMFWLIHGIMFGLPGALFMALTFISTCALVGKKAILDPKLSDFKTGYLIAMAGFFIVGWTVHFWNGTYSLFLFLLASGIWLADDASSPADGADGRRRNPISGDRGKETKATVTRTKRLGIRV
jgi:cyanate permease